MPKNSLDIEPHESEDLVLRKRLSGAINILYHTSNTILLRRIIQAKRARLDRKIRRSVKQNKPFVENVSYATPKIIFLRLVLYSTTFLFRVATKLRSKGRA